MQHDVFIFSNMYMVNVYPVSQSSSAHFAQSTSMDMRNGIATHISLAQIQMYTLRRHTYHTLRKNVHTEKKKKMYALRHTEKTFPP